jgi:hypothetical protein
MVDACMLPSTRKRRRWRAGALEDAPGPLRCNEHDCYWRMVLKTPFLGDEQNFLGLLMRFACDDARGYIVSLRNSHRLSYRR